MSVTPVAHSTRFITSTTPLGISAQYSTGVIDTAGYNQIEWIVRANQNGAVLGVSFDWSVDGLQTDYVEQNADFTGTTLVGTLTPKARYLTCIFVNGAVANTLFRHQVILRPY